MRNARVRRNVEVASGDIAVLQIEPTPRCLTTARRTIAREDCAVRATQILPNGGPMSKNANGRRKAILVRLTDEEHAALIRFARERGIHAAEVMRAGADDWMRRGVAA